MKETGVRFTFVATGEDNHLSCADAVQIAVEHFSSEFYEEIEPGKWIVFERSENPSGLPERGWAFQAKGHGFTLDTPSIIYEDIDDSVRLMSGVWSCLLSGNMMSVQFFVGCWFFSLLVLLPSKETRVR